MGIECWYNEGRDSFSEVGADKGLEGLTSLNSKNLVKGNPQGQLTHAYVLILFDVMFRYYA